MHLDRRWLQIMTLGLFLSAAVFLYLAFQPLERRAEIDFLNVGQGDSVLIRTPDNQFILIDGGPDRSALSRLGEVLPWYVRTLDLVILTHPHDDHVSGLINVLANYHVSAIASGSATGTNPSYVAWADLVKATHHTVSILAKGQIITLGKDCRLEILAVEGDASANDSSPIIKFVFKEFSVLLPGDIDEAEEQKLVETLGGKLSARVLKVAHHGSDLATSDVFMKAVGPEVAVISVGKNDYGHPSDRVIKRLERYGVPVYRTDRFGNIRLASDGGNWWLK